MTKKEVMDYVTETPQNVNKNILGQKLDEFQKNVSWNDLKDKPFYTEKEVILEKQTLGFVENNGMYGSPLPATLTIPTGEVTVMWDGVEYKCNNTDNIFGNTALMDGKDTGEPFVFGKFDSSWVAISLVSTATSHEVGIIGETVHKLDAKYLPDGIGGGGGGYDTVIKFNTCGDDSELISGTYADILAKLRAGEWVNVAMYKPEDGYSVEIIRVKRVWYDEESYAIIIDFEDPDKNDENRIWFMSDNTLMGS